MSPVSLYKGAYTLFPAEMLAVKGQIYSEVFLACFQLWKLGIHLETLHRRPMQQDWSFTECTMASPFPEDNRVSKDNTSNLLCGSLLLTSLSQVASWLLIRVKLNAALIPPFPLYPAPSITKERPMCEQGSSAQVSPGFSPVLSRDQLPLGTTGNHSWLNIPCSVWVMSS